MRTFIEIVLVSILAVIGLVFLVDKFMDIQERVDCYKLQTQAQEGYENFYITNWQSEMCEAQNIIVNAEVK